MESFRKEIPYCYWRRKLLLSFVPFGRLRIKLGVVYNAVFFFVIF